MEKRIKFLFLAKWKVKIATMTPGAQTKQKLSFYTSGFIYRSPRSSITPFNETMESKFYDLVPSRPLTVGAY